MPEEYCNHFIDTIHFQRLRRIEQTSTRPLYPSAHHDRFIHSLGTFHLGNKIFESIKHNSIDELGLDFNWDKTQKTFEIACLLHDCGHAPFSHTFEIYYDRPANFLYDKLILVADNESFASDVSAQGDAAPHEKISAILVLTVFKDSIEKLDLDPILVARMIIGCVYLSQESSNQQLFENCFIRLLKGEIIDVDRLDYAMRDKWASGFSASNINIARLIGAACIKKDGNIFKNCFKVNAISEIQSVLDVKNFQHLWIILHHKVVYDEYILKKAIEKLASQMTAPKSKESSLKQLFNLESFYSHCKIGKHQIYLPSDDDLVHFLKVYIKDNNYAEEWLSRNHQLKPVWKSFAEYNKLSRKLKEEDLIEDGNFYKQCDSIVKKFLKKYGQDENNFLKIPLKPKYKSIGQNEVNIAINGKIIDYELFKIPYKGDNVIRFFFYLYIPLQLVEHKEELRTSLFRL